MQYKRVAGVEADVIPILPEIQFAGARFIKVIGIGRPVFTVKYLHVDGTHSWLLWLAQSKDTRQFRLALVMGQGEALVFSVNIPYGSDPEFFLDPRFAVKKALPTGDPLLRSCGQTFLKYTQVLLDAMAPANIDAHMQTGLLPLRFTRESIGLIQSTLESEIGFGRMRHFVSLESIDNTVRRLLVEFPTLRDRLDEMLKEPVRNF